MSDTWYFLNNGFLEPFIQNYPPAKSEFHLPYSTNHSIVQSINTACTIYNCHQLYFTPTGDSHKLEKCSRALFHNLNFKCLGQGKLSLACHSVNPKLKHISSASIAFTFIFFNR